MPHRRRLTAVTVAAMLVMSSLGALPATAASGTIVLSNLDADGASSEAGDTFTFDVELSVSPEIGETVVISILTDDTTEAVPATATATFTDADWNIAQTITLNGVDDDVDDGDVSYSVGLGVQSASAGSTYGNSSISGIDNVDDDTRGVTVSAISGDTTEAGGQATFTVVLDTEPTADVTIGVSSDDTGEGTVDTASLTFTAANWDTAQTVTVTGVDDGVDDGNVAYSVVLATAVGGDYDGVVDPADVTVTNLDDDSPEFPSPDPEPDPEPTPEFTDTAHLSAEAQNAIARLVELGIANGTSDTTFSPDADVTRWQMALFLTRELEAVGVTLPTDATASFTDTGHLSAEAQAAVAVLATLDITTGVSETEFGPDGDVSRWQMALFLTRLLDAAGVERPATIDSPFGDTAGLSVEAQAAIDLLAEWGITVGTSSTTFSPNETVPRWQMAIFLIRVVDLVTA